jgi:hypothetical protein
MSEYAEVLAGLNAITRSIEDYAAANNRHHVAVADEVKRIWQDIGEIRDELHTLSQPFSGTSQGITLENDDAA